LRYIEQEVFWMSNRRGFTLVEIAIVFAVISVLAIIATTNLQSWVGHYSAVGFQREFLSRFNDARTRSMGSTFQHRLLIDLGGETVSLQRGNAGTASTIWVNAEPQVAGRWGAAIENITYPMGLSTDTSVTSGTFALIFNPDGQVLTQSDPASAATIAPLTQANIRLSASSVADRTTIRVFGWTAKARLLNGWM